MRLVVAVSEKQAAHTKKSHKELVEMLLSASKLPGATKAQVLAQRQVLFNKYKK